METATTRYLSCADTAKLVRARLKQHWPTTPFSVRSKTYSGGASINIHWTDGPTSKQVEHVAKMYEGAEFDGMVDLKTYHYAEYQGQRVRFGADYIFTNRHSSPRLEALRHQAVGLVGARCQLDERGWFCGSDPEQIADRMVSRMDCTTGQSDAQLLAIAWEHAFDRSYEGPR